MMPETLSLTGALVLGVGFGAGPCTVTCLPYLGPVFFAQGSAVRPALAVRLRRHQACPGDARSTRRS